MPLPSSRMRISFWPAGHDIDLQTARTGIEAVLNQFLDHGCRALHNLAGGDLVDQVTGKLLNRHASIRTGERAIFSKHGRKVSPECNALKSEGPRSAIRQDISVWPIRMLSFRVCSPADYGCRADVVALGDFGNRIASRDHVADLRGRVAAQFHRNLRIGRRIGVEIITHAGQNCACQATLVRPCRAASFSSVGFEMNPVSTRIEGMSGDFQNEKPACCTVGDASSLPRPICRSPCRRHPGLR